VIDHAKQENLDQSVHKTAQCIARTMECVILWMELASAEMVLVEPIALKCAKKACMDLIAA
jgi:hypothetical protein